MVVFFSATYPTELNCNQRIVLFLKFSFEY
ncbi:MAG: hypothetical protein RL766_2126 [Bacteroidota bacterium]